MAIPLLGDDEVHVWDINLDFVLEQEILSLDEREKAARFRFEIHHQRFVTGRSAVRQVLGAYMNRPPGEIRFSYGSAGKPSVGDFAFNLAHSEGVGLLAVTRRPSIGVDVEIIRRMGDMGLVARAAFAPGEVRRWEALPEDERVAAFHRCWTRKEAYLKATGEGIAQRLHSFEVAFEPGETARIVSGAEGKWTLIDLSHEPRHAAAAAVEGGPVALRRIAATELLRKI